MVKRSVRQRKHYPFHSGSELPYQYHHELLGEIEELVWFLQKPSYD